VSLLPSTSNDLLANEIGRSFPLSGALTRLAGGEGRTYRAGGYVYRREHRRAEATYVAELYARLPMDGFRIPCPLRTHDGTWLSPDGWSGWSYVAGVPVTPPDVPAVLSAIEAFHRALAHEPFPELLTTKDNPYTRAERRAWEDMPEDLDPDIAQLVALLLRYRHPLPQLRHQLIHVDLNDANILVAPGEAPALIDFTPAWRPTAYATAMFAYWIGLYRENRTPLDQFLAVPAFAQLLIRATLSKLLTIHELRRQEPQRHWSVAAHEKPVRVLVEWLRGQGT
jgi:Ser/Thr protein kinase RdoA (MazF antagonist)